MLDVDHCDSGLPRMISPGERKLHLLGPEPVVQLGSGRWRCRPTMTEAPLVRLSERVGAGSLELFAALCSQLAATTKKLEKRALISAYLGGLPVEDAARASLYLAGAPFAETDRRRLQVGGAALSKAVAQLSGADAAAMHAAYRRHGDLGDAAYDLLVAQHTKEAGLTLAALEEAFTALALARGPAAKLALLLALLGHATPLEARYIIKLAAGDMRTGVKQSLVEDAVAACYQVEPAAVRRAVMLNGSLAEVVAMAASGSLQEARMRLFHPLGFMLASPVDSVDEALARFAQEVAAEIAADVAEEVAEEVAAAKEVSPRKRVRSSAKGGANSAGLAGAAAGDDMRAEDRVEPPAVLDPARAASLLAAAPPALRAAQIEDKYDGMRAQLHCGDATQPGRVGLFSRNREDLSESFPELMEAFAAFGEEVILDGEILAWQPGAGRAGQSNHREGRLDAAGLDQESAARAGAEAAVGLTVEGSQGRALPFSSLQQRLGRKRVTAEMRAGTPVVFMAFDLLYQGGELLLEQPLWARRARLEALVAAHGELSDGRGHSPAVASQGVLFAQAPRPAGFARLLLAPAVQLADAAQLDAAYLDARGRGNEGVMLKAAASLYQPGRRGLAWLKLKRELATLDVVITGAEFGNGRRARLLSDYTFAVRAADGELLNVGKAYSGLTDVEVEELSRVLMEQTIEEYGSFRTVEPTVVLEVAFNNVMRSERHASGFALRFPRILRIRTDKPLEEIDTLARVEEIYGSQPDKAVEA